LVGFRRKVNRNDGQGRKSKLVVKNITNQGKHKNGGPKKKMGSRMKGSSR